jgi:hypothetical protein
VDEPCNSQFAAARLCLQTIQIIDFIQEGECNQIDFIQEGEQHRNAAFVLNTNITPPQMSSSRRSMMVEANDVDNVDAVVDVDVEKDSEQHDDNDGSLLFSQAGDQKEPARTEQEKGAIDKLKEECKEEETIEAGAMKTTPRDVARRRKIKRANGNRGAAAAHSNAATMDGVPSGAARSDYNHDDIYSLSSSSSSSARPGAYRVGPHNEDDDEDDVTRSSTVVPSCGLPIQGVVELQGFDALDSDLEALAAAEATRVLQQEREQQPVIEAVAQVDNAGQFEPSGQENEEYKVFGLPKWCIKWLFLGKLMVIIVVAIYFVTQPKPPTMAPTAAPTMAVTAKDPINTMVDLLRDYVPDIDAFVLSQPNSTEYRAVEWLARNNYTSSLSQGYAMVVLYLETGGDTGNWSNSTLWLSEEPICDWYGVGCNGTKITTLNLGKCGETLNKATLV